MLFGLIYLRSGLHAMRASIVARDLVRARYISSRLSSSGFAVRDHVAGAHVFA